MGDFSGGSVIGLALAVAAFIGVVAPMVLSTGKGRSTPSILALILTVAAGAVAFSSKTSFDLILAAAIWIGGMIAGVAGYLQIVIDRAARNHAYRLIHMHDAGLTKPKDTE